VRDFDFSDIKDFATDEEHKKLMLEMLIAFDKFCQQHGLTYYLSGGTLLGAARHKGFIPWDDDIDVNMPRPDCERLMQLSGGQIDRFELMPPNPSLKYFSYHWKLYADSILVAKRAAGGIGDKVYPVFMDIFPIEGLPETEKLNEAHFAQIIKLKNRVNHARRLKVYLGRNPVRMIISRGFNLLYSLVGIKPLYEKVISHAKTLKFEDSTHVGVMMTNVHTTEERVVKSEYTPVIKMKFEGHDFPCPAGFDTYLRQLYGPNYMELLPIHQRFPRHNLATFHNFKTGEKPSLTSTGSIQLKTKHSEIDAREAAIEDE
jgi:lipopolysaccharide cholinephosphotransferase